MIGAWLAGLATVVGVAAWGGGPSTPSDEAAPGLIPPAASAAVQPTASPSRSRSRLWPPPTSRPSLADLRRGRQPSPVVIDLPSRTGQDVTTRLLIVHGRVAEGVREVRLALETGDGSRLAIEAIDPVGLPRLGMIPFITVFELPAPPSAGSTVLYVVPIDGGGSPLDAAPRRYEVGASVDIAAGRGDQATTTRFDE